MEKLDLKESIEVDVSAEKAWEIIGPNFVNIQGWARGINKSWKNDSLPVTLEGAPAGGRFCDLGKFGTADERIVHYSEDRKEITWSAEIDKMPSFLSDLRNALKVEVIDEGSSRVTTNITADLNGVKGWFLGRPIKGNFSKLLKGFVKDWKTYAETGKASDTKQRELNRISK